MKAIFLSPAKLLFLASIVIGVFITQGCEKKPIEGCTDILSSNYNPDAEIDDGSCIYPPVTGCMNPEALNYNPNAVQDNGNCVLPQQKQKAFLLEYTATWCGPCGSWGTPAAQAIEQKYGHDVVIIAAHSSGDPMYVPSIYNDLKSSRPTSSIPTFFVGDDKTYSDNAIDNWLAVTPKVSSAAVFGRGSSEVSVTARAEFFEEATGEYYMSVFLLENEIDGGINAPSNYQQNGTTDDNYMHNHTLRASFTPNTYGEQIGTGTIAKGTKVDKTYKIPVDASWDYSNLYAVTIIWKYEGGMYKFVNITEHY